MTPRRFVCRQPWKIPAQHRPAGGAWRRRHLSPSLQFGLSKEFGDRFQEKEIAHLFFMPGPCPASFSE